MVLGVQFIGLFFYLFYGAPLEYWGARDPGVELRQLELTWDQQRMFLRVLSAITFTILVGQVIAVMKQKYGDIWEERELLEKERLPILVNAAQLAFLLLGWWGLVFGRILRRMDQVQLRLRELSLPVK